MADNLRVDTEGGLYIGGNVDTEGGNFSGGETRDNSDNNVIMIDAERFTDEQMRAIHIAMTLKWLEVYATKEIAEQYRILMYGEQTE